MKGDKLTLMVFSSLILLGCEGVPADQQNNKDYLLASIPATIELDRSIQKRVTFIPRYYGEGDWKGALALNIYYPPIVALRRQIERKLYNGRKLKFLRQWSREGEAHVTTITPVEYQNCMWSKKRGVRVLHMKEINKVMNFSRMNIQGADLKILGMGIGYKKFQESSNSIDHTHFIIVESEHLIKIRVAVYSAYLRAGGEPNCWKPKEFFPHVTVGYTHEDIHFPDVKKNIRYSLNRFLLLVPSKK